jgi:SOS response regulatory protein OraA/RecX
MTGGPESHPDRPSPAQPVRVARFDDLGAPAAGPRVPESPGAVEETGGEPRTSDSARVGGDRRSEHREAAAGDAAHRVVGFETLGTARERPVKVVGFDDLDGAAPIPRVRRLDDLSAAPGTSDRTQPVPRNRRRARAGGQGLRGVPPALDRPVDERDAGDPLPPDGPLPRGRRRSARVGRLGPDAPDPDRSEPDADPVVVAREICLRLLTDRARTRAELTQALARKGVPDAAAAAVLDRFDEVGLIDDAAFAGQWVRSRHQHRGLGRRAIAVELRRKGVADDVAGEALAEVDTGSEARRARELVDRKLRSLAVGTPEQRASAGRRLVGMLARKGYGAGIAYGVVRDALAERGADVDELGSEPAD